MVCGGSASASAVGFVLGCAFVGRRTGTRKDANSDLVVVSEEDFGMGAVVGKMHVIVGLGCAVGSFNLVENAADPLAKTHDFRH